MGTANTAVAGREQRHARDRQAVLVLRWILIIATAYLMLFHSAVGAAPPVVALFIAAYLGSNVVAGYLLPRAGNPKLFETGIVFFDALAVSLALLLTHEARSDFFLLYFVVMFIGALTDRLELVVATALVISVLHVYTLRLSGAEILASGYILRIPFLFVVALFFGHFVQRSRAAEREASEMRTEFVNGVIHDLKGPLGTVLGMSEVLLEGADAKSLTAAQADLVRSIHASTQRVVRLSLNLLDATRIETGRLALHRERARLAKVTEDTLSLARSASDLKGISVHLTVEPALPEVEIDTIQMERVIWNLVDNAIRYTPSGGTVAVRLERGDGEVVLSVTDSGPGIPDDELPTLFERYKRSRARQSASSGLGLFIVKAIVEAHGGTVEAGNRPEGGARVRFRLPAPPAQSKATDTGPPPSRPMVYAGPNVA